MTRLLEKRFESTVGVLRLVASERALVGVYFPEHHPAPQLTAATVRTHPVLDHAARELREYFAGARTSFSVALDARGTVFQRKVWRALGAIRFGERRSYAQLATAIGRPGAARAVGSANARNPLSIFVPCHRVLASSGELAGYAGGLPAKTWLLDHERRVAQGLASGKSSDSTPSMLST